MAAASGLDNEFMQYWLKLSLVQKESLLSVARNFVGLQNEVNEMDLRKKLIQDEREKYLLGEGLGVEFLDELEIFYTTLLQNPSSYGYYERPIRQSKVNRFPM